MQVTSPSQFHDNPLLWFEHEANGLGRDVVPESEEDFPFLPEDAGGFVGFEKVFSVSEGIAEDGDGGLDAFVCWFSVIHHEFIIPALNKRSKGLRTALNNKIYFSQSASNLSVSGRGKNAINGDAKKENSRQSCEY